MKRSFRPLIPTMCLAAAGVAGVVISTNPAAAAPAITTQHSVRGITFTHGRVTNEWFPLKPGVQLVYQGVKDGKHLRDVFYTEHTTRTIQGVVCRAVRDRGYLNGKLQERTTDWYAQSKRGDVWYFGERTAELRPNGQVKNRAGSWLAGRNGAKPGIYITAHPRVGQTHQQEYYPGHAEDHFKVINTSATVSVPLLESHSATLTKEWTPIEPHVLDHKYYVRDIGVVKEQAVKGPQETARLVSIRRIQ